MIGGTRSLQFRPGTRFSYVNQNFRILSDALEERTGRGFAELLRTRLFERVGMGSAFLAADTRAMPDGTEGYEGSQAAGFRPAVNRIVWTGDAGLGASLDDMIAWERHIDATREDAGSLYRRLSAPVTFADGAEAGYGFGLGRRMERGRAVTGHGGALRGWRSHRLHAVADRVSVVVLFNHPGDAQAAAVELFEAAVGVEAEAVVKAAAPADLLGAYVEPETGLSVRLEAAEGKVRLRYGTWPEMLAPQPDGGARGAGTGGTRVRVDGDGVWMDRPGDNQRSRLQPVTGVAASDVCGRYRCGELGRS